MTMAELLQAEHAQALSLEIHANSPQLSRAAISIGHCYP